MWMRVWSPVVANDQRGSAPGQPMSGVPARVTSHSRSVSSAREADHLMPLWPPLAPTTRLNEREAALTTVQSEIVACRACEQAGYLACARPLAHSRGP